MRFSIKKFLKNRPLSWSALASFEYDPEQWYQSYILGNRSTSKEMIFGSKIGKMIEKDPEYFPEIKRHSRMEYPFKVMFEGIPLVGYADSFCDKTCRKLSEFKTGKKLWNQKRVDEHRQIDMYLLMNFIANKIKPEEVEVTLVWLPTKETDDFRISFADDMKPQVFRTSRTMADILRFGTWLQEKITEMEAYANGK